jgi:hypothetical protein
MSKTLTWVLVGVLAVAGLGLVAFLEFGPRAEPAVSAAPTPPAEAVAGSTERSAVAGALGPSATGQTSGTASAAPEGATSSTSAALPAVLNPAPTVDELIQNAAAYEGAAVSLRGTILTQCTAGCEFALDDGTGVLSVQLEGKGKDRLIPVGKVGKKIAVQGVFRGSPRPQIVIEDPNGWQFVK